jgi:hypothetical protein
MRSSLSEQDGLLGSPHRNFVILIVCVVVMTSSLSSLVTFQVTKAWSPGLSVAQTADSHTPRRSGAALSTLESLDRQPSVSHSQLGETFASERTSEHLRARVLEHRQSRHTGASTTLAPKSALVPVSETAARKLLLCSHGRLLWFNVVTRETAVLHEGRGIYYGIFPGDNTEAPSVWVVSRPHNWKPTTAKEYLLQIDLASGEVLKEVEVPTRFGHDAVRAVSCQPGSTS